MKKSIKVFVLLFAAMIVLQFFRIDKTNPPVIAAETLDTAVGVPPDVSLILGRSCNDCHSNLTQYPWYSNIQPFGWFLKDHIDDGRRHLNFSTFATYAKDKQIKKLEEICEEVEAAKMPLPSYLWIHRDAKLSESESKALCDWTKDAVAKMEQ